MIGHPTPKPTTQNKVMAQTTSLSHKVKSSTESDKVYIVHRRTRRCVATAGEKGDFYEKSYGSV
jgi:hypothetical protein